MSYDAPFAGLKVVDLSQGVAGPYCGMLLAQHGADVIKVEPTGEGDWSRTLGKRYGGHTAYSIPTNLGKRSIALDLKSAEGKDVLWRLIGGADVLLEGFRPGVLDRLGFGYEAVAKREPRILYLSVSGFGQTGPLAGRPAMDPVLQAFTGLMMDNKGEDGIPHRVPFVVIDMSTALYAFQALSAALYARRDVPQGRRIEVSLLAGGERHAGDPDDDGLSRGRARPARPCRAACSRPPTAGCNSWSCASSSGSNFCAVLE